MELDALAGRKANALTWVGLGLMSVQFGVLARLTWWEYSWDVSCVPRSAVSSFLIIFLFLHPSDYGTGDVLRYIWNSHGRVCLLRVDETSEGDLDGLSWFF